MPNEPKPSSAPIEPPKAKPPTAKRSAPMASAPKAESAGPVRSFEQLFQKISISPVRRVGIYGGPGWGKTTFATGIDVFGPVAMYDFDRSLPALRSLAKRNVYRVEANNYSEVRESLRPSPAWDKIKSIIIDSATVFEKMCFQHVIENVPHEKGQKVKNIEGYGFGKGYRFVFDAFMEFIADLDAHANAGRNIVLVMHDITSSVPNPKGEDYLRYEPLLHNSEKSSIRAAVRVWLDHLLYCGTVINVTEDGKAKGDGIKCVYASEQGHCMAKNRDLPSNFFEYHLDKTDGSYVPCCIDDNREAVDLWPVLLPE